MLKKLFALMFLSGLVVYLLPNNTGTIIANSTKIFLVQNIEVVGNESISTEEIEKNFTKTDNLLSLDLKKIKLDIESNPLIEKASIQRIYPSTIKITILERKPYAIFKDTKEKYFLIDKSGVIVKEVGGDLIDNNYVIVQGKNSKDFYGALLEQLISNDINPISMEFISQRRWNITLKNQMIVKLPEKNIDSSIKVLQKLILSDKMVDLRFMPEKILIKDYAKTEK